MRFLFKPSLSIVVGLVCLTLFGIICITASGATLKVDDDGDKDYTKIQDAIDASDNGDTIIVYDGFYHENLMVDKQLTITGSGSDTTSIRGGGDDDVIHISADSVDIQGFHITKSGTSGGDAGIDIRADGATISNNRVDDNGRGIYLGMKGGGLKNFNNLILNNTIVDNDQGIYASFSENAVIRGNNCSDNDNDGIYVVNTRRITIANNSCSGNPQGINLQGSDNITVESNLCSGNVYGIYIDESEHNTIEANLCSGNEYGITVNEKGQNTIQDNHLDMNEFGIYLILSTENGISRNLVMNSTQIGIYLRGSSDNTIRENTATGNDDGIVFLKNVVQSSKDNLVRENMILGNLGNGMVADENGGFTVDATYNYWGHSSGPHHPSSNPDGEGDGVSNDVDFDPWTHIPDDYPMATAVIDDIDPSPVLVGEEVHFSGSVLEARTVMNFVWTSSIDGVLYNSTQDSFSSSGLSMGTHNITFRIIDDQGIWSIEAWEDLIVHTDPIATIVSITPSPALDVDVVSFVGEGTDDSGIVLYEWRSSLSGVFYSGPLTVYDHTGLSNGTHIIYLRVQDDQGGWSAEVNDTLVVNGRPVVRLTSVTPVPGILDELVTFILEGTDDGSVQLYKVTSDLDGIIYSGPNGTFTLTNLSVGTHTLTLQVRDDTGTWSKEVGHTLVVLAEPLENIIPTIILRGPANGTEFSEKFKVKGTADDEDGAVQRVELSIDGGNWEIAQGTVSWSLIIDIKELDLGEHTIRIRSYDGQNYSQELTLRVLLVEPEEDDDESFLPILGLAGIAAAVALSIVIFHVMRKRKSR